MFENPDEHDELEEFELNFIRKEITGMTKQRENFERHEDVTDAYYWFLEENKIQPKAISKMLFQQYNGRSLWLPVKLPVPKKY